MTAGKSEKELANLADAIAIRAFRAGAEALGARIVEREAAKAALDALAMAGQEKAGMWQ